MHYASAPDTGVVRLQTTWFDSGLGYIGVTMVELFFSCFLLSWIMGLFLRSISNLNVVMPSASRVWISTPFPRPVGGGGSRIGLSFWVLSIFASLAF
jgi:hypothetical protein